jgi:hypothetical protein
MASSPQTQRRCEVVTARCETCGNDYDKAFQVSMGGTIHTFDSFECAIHELAPTCENCGIRIVGHGLEKDGHFLLLRALRASHWRKRSTRSGRRGGVTGAFAREDFSDAVSL